MVRRITFLISCCILSFSLKAQYLQKPAPSEIASAPEWARLMYSESPNVFIVDAKYSEWRKSHEADKTYHSQYYKRWHRSIDPWVQTDGSILTPTLEQMQRYEKQMLDKRQENNRGGASGWNLMGPNHVMDNSLTRIADQTNVYSIDRCEANNSILYCGTETALIFKSTDAGNNWLCVSSNLTISAVTAIEIDPANADIVYAGAGKYIWKTTDGGSSWNTVLTVNNLDANEILVHPGNTQIVMVAANKGYYRSTDGGTSWATVYTNECYDLKLNTGNAATVYLLKDNPSVLRCEFLLSTDSGATFNAQLSGWYNSTDAARFDGGARLAVTPSDPNRVYAYLIGQSKNDDFGFIGVYRSDDGGVTWTLPNGPDGGPYTTAHPNLAMGTTTWTYHQGFYNCALMASPTDPDKILIGGLNLWRSDDGGLTFTSVSGYIGGPLNMHVDNQDFRSFGNEQWLSCDGGIYRSTDFFTTQPEVKMDGVHGSDYWGFGSGWNEDVLVGGLYHNGNLAFYENYASGEFLTLGGGEASTGYVNPGMNRKTYFSDIGGRLLPQNIGDPVAGIPFAMAPNESYGAAESSEMEFHPNCYNIAFIGNGHKLWKTWNGGASFTLVDSFGATSDSKIQAIEISRSNPEVMYISQRPASVNNGFIRKTTDGGQTWSTVPLPGTSAINRSKILLALSPENENFIWAAFPNGSNSNKIYKSTNGGTNWTNITTSILDGENIHSILLTSGTDGGVYACTNWSVYYRDNNMGNWTAFNSNLPVQFSTDIARPFYRDGKIRIASYVKGIWESEFMTQPTYPIATATVDKWSAICTSDTFYFEDYSMLNHSGASWSWTFQNGTPSTSSLRNPKVVFNSIGTFSAMLTVTDSAGNSASDTIEVSVTGVSASSIAETFENVFLPLNWSNVTSGNLSWSQTGSAGGFGVSYKSAIANNYDVDASGTWCDMRAPVNFSNVQNAQLFFDVAYTPWGGGYSDTLEIMISTDCGASWNTLYRKGGLELGTAGAALNSTIFIPNSAQWRKDSVDLSPYSGNNLVSIAFRNWAHFGQAMYLDNINVSGSAIVGSQPMAIEPFAQLFPNPVTSSGNLHFISDSQSSFSLSLIDMNGKKVLSEIIRSGENINLSNFKLAAGLYTYELKGNSIMKFGKLVVVETR